MTKWERLCAQLLSQIEAGDYPEGTRLPTHRQYAKQNNVSLAVVNKIYDKLKSLGAITTGRRRGSIVVRNSKFAIRETRLDQQSIVPTDRLFDLTHNYPNLPDILSELKDATISQLRSDKTGFGSAPTHINQAGEAWFDRLGITRERRLVTCCLGGQHALLTIIMMLREQYKTIYADSYTYSGLRLAARALGVNVVAIAGDRDGMDPDALASSIQRYGLGLVYLMPSLHNPMAFTMPEDRMRVLGRIIAAAGCAIIEDETYRYLVEPRVISFADLPQPETFTISTMSKIYGPVVQLAFVAAPARYERELAATLRACVWNTESPFAAVVSNWILGAEIDRHVELIRRFSRNFQDELGKSFPQESLSSSSAAFFCWLKLPENWREKGFVDVARDSNILIVSDRNFLVGKSDHSFVRFSGFSPTSKESEISSAVKILATIYNSDPTSLIRSA